jgi:hypothetical protein
MQSEVYDRVYHFKLKYKNTKKKDLKTCVVRKKGQYMNDSKPVAGRV